MNIPLPNITHANRILYDRDLAYHTAKGSLNFVSSLAPNQQGPVTLDVHAGRIIVSDTFTRSPLDTDGSRCKVEMFKALEHPPSTGTYDGKLGEAIPLNSGQSALVAVKERFVVSDAKLIESYSLRKKISRLGLSIGDTLQFDGEAYVALINKSPNRVILRGGDSFGSLAFKVDHSTGMGAKLVEDYQTAASLFPNFASAKLIAPNGKLIFTVGDNIYRMRDFPQENYVDTNKNLDFNHLYSRFPMDGGQGRILWSSEQTVVELAPIVDLDARLSLVFDKSNSVGDGKRGRLDGDFKTYTPLIEPGFCGRVNVKLAGLSMPTMIYAGDVFATASIYFNEKPAIKPKNSSYVLK